MTPAWAQRQEELLSDCIVSPDVFTHMVDHLRDFVRPYQHALETGGRQAQCVSLPGRPPVPLTPQECRGHRDVWLMSSALSCKTFIGTAPWDYRPLIEVLVRQVADRLGETRWDHRVRSEQLSQARHTFGGGSNASGVVTGAWSWRLTYPIKTPTWQLSTLPRWTTPLAFDPHRIVCRAWESCSDERDDPIGVPQPDRPTCLTSTSINGR